MKLFNPKILFFIVILFFNCTSDDDSSPQTPNNGVLTAVINGEDFSASGSSIFFQFNGFQGIFLLSAFDSEQDFGISIEICDVTGTSTFDISACEFGKIVINNIDISEIVTPENSSLVDQRNSGFLTITGIENGMASGTFEFEIELEFRDLDTDEVFIQTIAISDGIFTDVNESFPLID